MKIEAVFKLKTVLNSDKKNFVSVTIKKTGPSSDLGKIIIVPEKSALWKSLPGNRNMNDWRQTFLGLEPGDRGSIPRRGDVVFFFIYMVASNLVNKAHRKITFVCKLT